VAGAGSERLAQRQRAPGEPGETEETDGRRARSLRTRANIVDAFLQLLRETGSVPTAAQIGKRAGCSTRSVFERFVDFQALFAAAFDHVLQNGLSIPVGDMPTRDRKTRIAFHVNVRATNCENWLPLWRVVMRADIDSADVMKARITIVRGMSRARVEMMFAPELSAVSQARREATLIAIEALTDYESWGRMREHYGYSFEEACGVWRMMIDQLLPRTPPVPFAVVSPSAVPSSDVPSTDAPPSEVPPS
jgi:AcrR family transcriptional regulator